MSSPWELLCGGTDGGRRGPAGPAFVAGSCARRGRQQALFLERARVWAWAEAWNEVQTCSESVCAWAEAYMILACAKEGGAANMCFNCVDVVNGLLHVHSSGGLVLGESRRCGVTKLSRGTHCRVPHRDESGQRQ